MIIRGLMLGIVLTFYSAYFIKAVLLARRGIRVNFLGEREKAKEIVLFEKLLRTATVAGGIVQFISPFFSKPGPLLLSILGLGIACLGTGIFIVAVRTMQNNWRVGFSEGQETELVTKGIYQYSRNPAFVGFDCLYIGMALVFPNILTISLAIGAMLLFHLQINQEEAYLAAEFGENYRDYQQKVRKYF
ncbi:methyltransferase family protein [Candidatus Enterococcus ferrettii]|uniref:Isoprenylcysteine carboxylmethyltransferase family protein n=1 Tax=Candidatus Enterococcus ferrettii TaxID=2815324 RepID=A0ABV0ERR2_9ENTE|nr:isoprenylcysteine carboxylmethyltransferase family protein [Enterococcus sp. 665A]MBO1341944.1 isoprenylcysteine carboxylmethyltransferase family protein [Enterococcus sp. 665A]